jgi:hypothetical protein
MPDTRQVTYLRHKVPEIRQKSGPHALGGHTPRGGRLTILCGEFLKLPAAACAAALCDRVCGVRFRACFLRVIGF